MKKLIIILLIIVVFDVFLALGYYFHFFENRTFSADKPELDKDFQLIDLTCGFNENENCSQIKLTFTPVQQLSGAALKYEIKDLPEKAETQIIFSDIKKTENNFSYEEIIDNPLIEDIAQQQIGNALILTIKRKGPITPSDINVSAENIVINLPMGNNDYPQFSGLTPNKDSSVYPGWRTVSAKAMLSAPLKVAYAFLQEEPIDLTTKELGENQYSFEFGEFLVTDQEYKIKIIAIDSEGRATAQVWSFAAQKYVSRVKLGHDRFQYLGWWGDINNTVSPVMEQPNNQAKQLGTFSTINRVKVLKEVEGEEINGNNLWLQIDGGAHPGAYIHSDFVFPIAQPEPPANPKIPEGVGLKDYWIDTDLTKRILTLFLYDKPVLATYVATGRPGNPTLEGTWRIWYKLVKTRMRGGPPVVSFFYDLPNVPYVLYYNGAYGIHGTYWHDKFGTRQSSGCTNLTQGDAKFIFDKVNPALPTEKTSIMSGAENQGTVVYNHL